MRYWLLLFAAMFVANNVAAAVRGCLLEPGGQGHAAVLADEAGTPDPLCVVGDAAARCVTHCVQSADDDGQKFSIDLSAPIGAPSFSGTGFWVQAAHRDVFVASPAPVVGPRLTILYRNFRN